MGNIFATADLHLGHANVLDYCKRPFANTDDMREGLIERWNDVVSPQDVVYVLGDVSLHPRELDFFDHVYGTKRLIAGNHDKVWSGHKDSHKYFSAYLEHFETIDAFRKIKFAGKSIMLSHFPYFNEFDQRARYKPYRLVDFGYPLIHGHVHQQWKFNSSWARSTPMINAGVDVWDYTPVPLETIVESLDTIDWINLRIEETH